MGDISQIMIALGSMDPAERVPAEQTVASARDNDLAGFLVALVKEMRDDTKPDSSRQMAGVVLKNSVAFDAREEERKRELAARWTGLDAETRGYVKAEMLQALDSNPNVRRIVSLVIANLARIELPANEWPNLIPDLCNAVATNEPVWMETALTALGYICEECDGDDALTNALAAQSGTILNSIFAGLYHDVTAVRYNAVNALCNAIDFVGNHLEDASQRAQLMTGIVDAAGAADANTRQKALETLVGLVQLYYEALHDHIEQLWAVTTNAVRMDEEECGLQGLLFWLAVCETEVDLEGTTTTNQQYAKATCAPLFQLLTECLQKQQDGQTDEDWNISTAASKVLVALAEAVGDDIVAVAMPFIHANIVGEAWQQRESALVALGCILHGPDPGVMRQTVAEALPTVCGYASDANPMVADSAMWALSVMCAEFSDVILEPQTLAAVLAVVAPTLSMAENMACRGAAVIHNLCLHYDDDEDEGDDEEGGGGNQQSNALSPYYHGIVQGLFAMIQRPDVTDKMRVDGQEALNRLFGAAAMDVHPVLIELIPTLLGQLETTTTQAKQTGLTPELELQQGLLVGALNHICRQVKRAVTDQLPAISSGLITMFSCSRDGSVLVEAIMCIGALALATREAFIPYLEQFHQYVQGALVQFDDYDLCSSALATLGDISTAVEGHMAPMLNDTMTTFVNFLQTSDEECDRDIKPVMINCLGDITLNCGGATLAPYVDALLGVIQTQEAAARAMIAEMHTQEDEDYAGELWEAVLSFGTGLVQGFSEDPTPILGHLDYLLDAAVASVQAVPNDLDVLKAAVTIIGDMANVMRHGPPQYVAAAKGKLCTPTIQALIQSTSSIDEEEAAHESGKWAFRELQYLSNC